MTTQEYENMATEELESIRAKLLIEIGQLDSDQSSKKILINSAYGFLSTPHSRVYDKRLAASITLTGQIIIRFISYKLDEFLNKQMKTTGQKFAVYSDTDSVYLTLEHVINKFVPNSTDDEKLAFIYKIEPLLQRTIDAALKEVAEAFGCYNSCMKMKRENICTSAIWTEKKRYVMNVIDSKSIRYSKPKQKVVGMEIKRSSTPPALLPFHKAVLDIALSGTQEQAFECINSWQDKFMAAPLTSICIVKGVSKVEEETDDDGMIKVVEGKMIPGHVKSAMTYNNMLVKCKLTHAYQPIKGGDKLKLVYLKLPNPTNEKAIAFHKTLPPEFGLEKYIDRDLMWEKNAIQPTTSLFKVLGWTTHKVTTFDC